MFWGDVDGVLDFGIQVPELFLPEIHIDETELCGIADQFNGAVEVQLVHDVGPVVLNRLGTNEEFFGNLFAGESLCQQAHDFLLPGG